MILAYNILTCNLLLPRVQGEEKPKPSNMPFRSTIKSFTRCPGEKGVWKQRLTILKIKNKQTEGRFPLNVLYYSTGFRDIISRNVN